MESFKGRYGAYKLDYVILAITITNCLCLWEKTG